MFAVYVRILILALCAGAILAQSTCETNRLNNAKSGKQKARGANLGSWLVLESWMTPGPWDQNNCNKTTNPGSYLLEKCLGSRAQSVMDKHWATQITEDDFVEMSKRGVNVARLPVGWWQIYDAQGGASKAKLNYQVSPTNYVTGGLAYIDKAFEWGKKHGIAILLGMHAPPGSQNGQDHSSPASYPGQINWDKNMNNVGQTLDSMKLYAQRYGKNGALYGFYLLNEPNHINMTILQGYYKEAYKTIRQSSPDSYIVINPLISPFESGTEDHWVGFMNPDQGFTKVAMDLHYYSCFGGPGDQDDPDKAIDYINNERKAQIEDYSKKNPKLLFVGEWSNVGPKSGNDRFAQAQVTQYNQASLGWTFWAWAGGQKGNAWSLESSFNDGWIGPQYPC